MDSTNADTSTEVEASSSFEGSSGSTTDSPAPESSDASSSWFGTTWVELSSSGETTDSTTSAPAECGNGAVEGPELCDEEVSSLQPGACKPDCSGPIETRRILISARATQGDLGPEPIATVDAMCADGSKAMFADGVGRRATAAPNASVAPIDWVLEPFTAYVNAEDELVWVTDEVPLLGVRGGVSDSLIHPIFPLDGNPPGALTGMTAEWISPPQADCDGWTSGSSASDHSSGVPWLVDLGGFLDNGGLASCELFDRVYCVDQSGA